LLIAILREKNSTAARMLRERGADLDLIRFQLRQCQEITFTTTL